MPEPDRVTYRWEQGQGPDSLALERMRRAFAKPHKPMGEAWFMSLERKLYPRLLGRIEELDDKEIIEALKEIASGPNCFGQREEWTVWYHYLLPRLMLRPWRTHIYHPVEVLITGFMAQYPMSIDQPPYQDFRDDVVATLGRYIMTPHLWPGGVLDAGRFMKKYPNADGTFGWCDCDGLPSASLFLCLKYLTEDAVGTWFDSVLAIPNPRWKAQIFVWLVGAHPILTDEISQPAQFPEKGPFSITWDWSHALDGSWLAHSDAPQPPSAFLPAGNRCALLQVARRIDADEFFESVRSDPGLERIAAETAGLQERFVKLYQEERRPRSTLVASR